jgi:hypothetical protein
MEFFLSLIALLIASMGGAGMIFLLAPSRWRESPCGFVGAAMVVGAGIISLSSFCFGFVIQGVLLRWIVTLACLALFALGLVRCLKQADTTHRFRVNLVQVLLAMLVIGQLSFLTWLCLYKSNLGWDGVFVWEAKANIAFRHNGAIPLQYFTGGYEISHVAYPLFLSLLQLWIYEWLGHIDQSMIMLIGPYLYLAAVLLLIGSAKRATNSPWVAIIAVLLFGLVPICLLGYGGVASGYADVPLAVVWLCALVHSVEYWKTGTLSAARLTGVSAMFLPFVKNDGVIALLCIALTILPRVIQERNWKAAAWMMTPGFGVLFGWHMLIRLSHVKEGDLVPFTLANLLAHLNRTGTLIRLTIQELVTWDHWSILWPAAIIAGVLLISRTRVVTWFPLVLNALLPLILYPCVFFFSAWVPFEAHVGVALPRLFIHNTPAAILLLSVACGTLLGLGREKDVANRAAGTKIAESSMSPH